jgi:hypothetical protein
MPVAEKKAPNSLAHASHGATCDGCGVTVRWMAGAEQSGLPASWTKSRRGTYCLHCRRALAADKAVEGAPEKSSREERAKLRARALVEFEVKRDPDRPNGEIAKACRASVSAVIRARERVGA